MLRLNTITTLLAATLLSTAALADDKGDAKKSSARAKPSVITPGEKVAAFPLDAVNIREATVEASNEVFFMSLSDAGFTIADWKVGYKKVTGISADEKRLVNPPPPPEKEPPAPPAIEYEDVSPAPMDPELEGSDETEPEAEQSEEGGSVEEQPVEDSPETPRASQPQENPAPPATSVSPPAAPVPGPPPSPAPGTKPGLIPIFGGPVVSRPDSSPAPAQGYAPQAAQAPVEEKPPALIYERVGPDLDPELKKKIAKEMGCDKYVDGKMVRLGTKIRVTVRVRNLEGDILDSRRMEARTVDDLHLVFARTTRALAEGITVKETLTLDNATKAEADAQANRFKLEKNLGISLAQFFSAGDNAEHMTQLSFEARFEINDVIVGANLGLIFADKEGGGSAIGVDILAGYYFTHTTVAPYMAAGVGIMFDNFLMDFDSENTDDDDVSMDKVGFRAFPALGIEFIRNTRMRLHLEGRYQFLVQDGGTLGHGPAVAIGLNF